MAQQITYVAAGAAVQTSTTSLAMSAPACQENDILIAQIISINNTAIVAPTALWTEIQQANFTGSRAAIFWKRAVTADNAAAFTFTVGGTTTSYGLIYAWRGVKPHGNAIGTSTISANASSDTVTYATQTAHSNAGVLVAAGFYAEDAITSLATISGFLAPTINVEQATLEDAALFMSYRQWIGGATGALSQTTTSTVDAVNAGVLFDLMPAVEGGSSGGPKYPARNRTGDRP